MSMSLKEAPGLIADFVFLLNIVHRVRTESSILETVLKFGQQFSIPGKSLENGDKV